ncbi:hypothetical protein KBB76_00950 [Candidatus Saccharibacteria bacterium]|jgi:hypothetical protein|nr:hypothetical protein [Candidatus Saccharibacteria bacterium]
MKIKLLVALMTVVCVATIVTAPAYASMKTKYDFGYSVSRSKATDLSRFSSIRAKTSGGVGGAASVSGSRKLSLTTTMYSLFGLKIVSVKTISNWSWKNGVVTKHSWDEPVVTKHSNAFNITYNVTYGQYGWRTWRNKDHGCWYQTIKIHVVHSVAKVGVISEWDILHQYWLYGNGTYKWKSNY